MEITAEITEEQFRSLLRSYYLQKDWMKLTALLAIIALGISGYTAWPFWVYSRFIISWRDDFDVIFLMLFAIFCGLPYLVLYIQMRLMLRKRQAFVGICFYKITVDGIKKGINDFSKLYLWDSIYKVQALPECIVIKMNSYEMLIIPVIALQSGDSGSFLQLVKEHSSNVELVSLNDKKIF
jgi:hypothetical protein